MLLDHDSLQEARSGNQLTQIRQSRQSRPKGE